jgi:hypothetical protein
MPVTETAVTMALLSAYPPMLPTSHASAQREKSISVGSENGVAKIAWLVLKLDRTIQIMGKKKTRASRARAAETNRPGSRLTPRFTPPPPARRTA